MSAVAFYRQDATQDKLRIFMPAWGSGSSSYGEFQLYNYVTSFGTIQGLGGARAQDGAVSTQLVDSTPAKLSVWEPVMKVAPSGTPNVPEWEFCGMAHGFERITSKIVLIDGVDYTNVAPEFYKGGTTVLIAHQSNLLLPTDGVTVWAIANRKWTATAAGLRVDTVITPHAGYEWYSYYGAMLPITPLGAAGLNMIQCGSNPSESALPFPATETSYDLGSEDANYLAAHSGHPYTLSVNLPSGGPNVLPDASWTASLPEGGWRDETPSTAKLYITSVATEYAKRKTAAQRSHATIYMIDKAA